MLTPIYPSTRIIYQTTLITMIVIIGSLPFLKVEISTSAPAIVRPASEVSVIRSPLSGRITKVLVNENTQVKRGDLLYLIDAEQINSMASACSLKLVNERKAIEDIQIAIHESHLANPSAKLNLQTSFYRQAYITFLQRFKEASAESTRIQADYDRQKKLYDQRVIPAAEFEQHQYALLKAQYQIKNLLEVNRSQWESDLQSREENIHNLSAELISFQLQQDTHRILAPISGTVQNVVPIYPGTQVFANQELSQLSPDTTLLVLAYVTPENIANIQPGNAVKFQVNAFHHHQWGLANGHVTDVAQDSKLVNNQWVYEIRCTLEKNQLTHSLGMPGYLKKGMTLQAHFQKGSRTVWELLAKKIDDSLNPYHRNL